MMHKAGFYIAKM